MPGTFKQGMWQSALRRARTPGALLAAAVLAACVSLNSATEEEMQRLVVSAVSTSVGAIGRYDAAQGVAVEVNDYDGTRTELRWPAAAFDTARSEAFALCLKSVSQQARAAQGEFDNAQFVRQQVDRCASDVGVGVPVERALERATTYDLLVKFPLDPPARQGTGVPLSSWSNGVKVLQAARRITQSATGGDTRADVAACRLAASREGIVRTLEMQSDTRWSNASTIEPFIERLDVCLRERGYRISNQDQRSTTATSQGTNKAPETK